jgi:hypothetical protein
MNEELAALVFVLVSGHVSYKTAKMTWLCGSTGERSLALKAQSKSEMSIDGNRFGGGDVTDQQLVPASGDFLPYSINAA